MKKALLILTLLMATLASYFYFRLSRNATRDRQLATQANTEMEKSNNILRERCFIAYHGLREYLADPYTHSQATIWEPRALELKVLSEAINDRIDSLKSRLNAGVNEWSFYKSDESKRLFDNLVGYKTAFLDIFRREPNISDIANEDLKKAGEEFEKRLLPILSVQKTSDWATDNFKDISTDAATLRLTNIQNEILRAEMAASEFLFKQIQRGGDVYYVPHCFTCLNAQVLRKGQQLEATIYLFYMNFYGMNPEVRVNGIVQKMSRDNEIDYSQKVTNLGKHELKVNVKYLQPDSNIARFSKSMQYEVVP